MCAGVLFVNGWLLSRGDVQVRRHGGGHLLRPDDPAETDQAGE